MDLKNFNVVVLDTVTKEIIKFTDAIPSEVKTEVKNGGLIDRPVNMFQLADLADMDPTHRAAIEIKKNCILGNGWKFLHDKHKTKMKEINEFFLNPNDNFCETIDDILSNLIDDYETFGNAYLESAGISNKHALYHFCARDLWAKPYRIQGKLLAGRVEKWVQLHPDFTRKEFLDFASAKKLQSGQHYIVQLKNYTSKSSFYGLPKYLAAIQAIIENIYIKEYGMSFFKNDARPAVAILMTGGAWGDEQQKAVVQYMGTEMKGVANSHKVLVLHTDEMGANIKIQELSKVLDGNFLKETEKNRDEIARVHGPIPPKLLGISEGSGIGGGGESIGELKTFMEIVINKKQRVIENFVNKVLMKIFDIDWNPEFKFINIDITSAKDDAVVHSIYAKIIDKTGKPVLTVDEIRKRINMPIDAEGEYMSDSKKSPTDDKGGVNIGTDIQDEPDGITEVNPDKNKDVENPE